LSVDSYSCQDLDNSFEMNTIGELICIILTVADVYNNAIYDIRK